MSTYNYESANGGNGTEYHVTDDDGEDLGVVGRDDAGDEWYFLANDFREGAGATRDDAVEAALASNEPDAFGGFEGVDEVDAVEIEDLKARAEQAEAEAEGKDFSDTDEASSDALTRDDHAAPSEDVSALQNMLTNAGFPPANNPEPTGVFEYHTERAVKKFQKKWGLNVTGEVDAETTSLLEDKAS